MIKSMLLRIMTSANRLNVLRSHLSHTWPRAQVKTTLARSICTSSSYNSSTTSEDTIKGLLAAIIDSHANTSSGSGRELLTQKFIQHYCTLLTNEDKKRIILHLAESHRISLPSTSISEFVSELSSAKHNVVQIQQKLREQLIPPYELFFREIGAAESGVKFLVDFRSDILKFSKQFKNAEELSALRALSHNLKQLLSLWFGVGFLNLERITWQSSCDLLEKLVEYEAVHPVRNVSDLRLRVGNYRRCFVFTHPCMPREPLVILHVALSKDISSSIQSIVRHPSLSDKSEFSLHHPYSTEDTQLFNTAIFYSITSTQTGLQGIDLGNHLIKRVVKELLSEFPHLDQFSTLSPIPGFREWIITEINQELSGVQTRLLTDSQITQLAECLSISSVERVQVLLEFKKILQNGAWAKDAKMTSQLKSLLMHLCFKYLYVEKHRGYALNPVTNFHLKNGATMWRINWLANTTARGLTESCSIMVNYRYYLDRLESNSAQYIEGKIIDVDQQVMNWQ